MLKELCSWGRPFDRAVWNPGRECSRKMLLYGSVHCTVVKFRMLSIEAAVAVAGEDKVTEQTGSSQT